VYVSVCITAIIVWRLIISNVSQRLHAYALHSHQTIYLSRNNILCARLLSSTQHTSHGYSGVLTDTINGRCTTYRNSTIYRLRIQYSINTLKMLKNSTFWKKNNKQEWDLGCTVATIWLAGWSMKNSPSWEVKNSFGIKKLPPFYETRR
jgi:hypothetical protein